MADKDGMDSKQGQDNLDAAVSGDTSLAGANKEQIKALGGEVDDELDEFEPTAEDRGDILEEDLPADRGDEVEDKDADDEEADADADQTADGEEEGATEAEGDDDDEAEESEEEAESEDEEESDEDEEPDEKDSDEPKSKDKEQRIPKSRFDEVNARRKAAEEKLAALEAENSAEKQGEDHQFDFDQAEADYIELVLSGKDKEALQKRREIRAAEKSEWETEAVSRSMSSVEAQRVEADINQMVDAFEVRYDVFNPDSEAYSEDVCADVESVFKGYLSRDDLTPQQAFQLAVDTAVKVYDLQANDAGEAESPPPKTVRKKKMDTKKKIAIAKKAPKDTSKAGDAGDKAGDSELDINNLSDADLDALPESTKARLRGDFV